MPCDLDLTLHLTTEHWTVVSGRLVAFTRMDMLLFDIEDGEGNNQSPADEAQALSQVLVGNRAKTLEFSLAKIVCSLLFDFQ